jgi:protein-S-isoprenylcysteine O-methyltransferase Ste14
MLVIRRHYLSSLLVHILSAIRLLIGPINHRNPIYLLEPSSSRDATDDITGALKLTAAAETCPTTSWRWRPRRRGRERCLRHRNRGGLFVPLFKSVLHNIGVVIVGLGVAFLGTRLDLLLGIRDFSSALRTVLGAVLLIVGFLLRVWATLYFYRERMKVISLSPQRSLITSGSYRFSRNPLYLGGNVFVFLGAALLLRSPVAVFITMVHLPFLDLFIRREERQLERDFGEEWREYRKRVRRWL